MAKKIQNTFFMKYIISLFALFSGAFVTMAQAPKTLSIEDCYAQAQQNYPMAKQRDLILKSASYSIENASRGYLPQFNLNAQATYQSDVTQLPIKLPNVNIPSISKDQYKIYGDVNQVIYDAGNIKNQKLSVTANAAIETQKLEIELKKVKERINQLYFGILMLDEQLEQTEIFNKDIQSAINKTKGAITNGVALKSAGDVLKVELLKMNQHVVELKASRLAYLEMLGLFINQTLDGIIKLQKPVGISIPQTIHRPELLLIEKQKNWLLIQNRFIDSKNLPKVGLFVQGGFGRPALNMLNNDFSAYYIGGLRVNWSLNGLYTRKNEKAILSFNAAALDIQKETFLFNTNFILKQQNMEVVKLQELIKTDDEIVALRTKIKNTAFAQLENGVLNATDYLRELNAEDQAKQNKSMHEIQLLMTRYAIQFTMEN